MSDEKPIKAPYSSMPTIKNEWTWQKACTYRKEDLFKEIKQLEADKAVLIELVMSLKPFIELKECDWGIYQINQVLEKVKR